MNEKLFHDLSTNASLCNVRDDIKKHEKIAGQNTIYYYRSIKQITLLLHDSIEGYIDRLAEKDQIEPEIKLKMKEAFQSDVYKLIKTYTAIDLEKDDDGKSIDGIITMLEALKK